MCKQIPFKLVRILPRPYPRRLLLPPGVRAATQVPIIKVSLGDGTFLSFGRAARRAHTACRCSCESAGACASKSRVFGFVRWARAGFSPGSRAAGPRFVQTRNPTYPRLGRELARPPLCPRSARGHLRRRSGPPGPEAVRRGVRFQKRYLGQS